MEANKDRSKIESFSANGYSHLMKCVYHNRVDPSWAGTILNCNKSLYSDSSIVDIRRVMNDKFAMERIKRSSIKKYIDDKNKDAERIFGITLTLFPTLMDLRDPIKITNYLLDIANQTNNIVVINKCKKHLSELKL